MRQVRKQGLRGLEASTIGLTLVGYIAAGFFIGQWLDGHFKTAFWMPLLVLVGTAAGFRDIIKLVNRMGASAETDGEDRAVGRRTVFSQDEESKPAEIRSDEAENRPRPRIFEVPAPPRASFDKAVDEGRSTPALNKADDTGDEDEATLINKLLDESGEESGSDTK